MKIIIGNSMNDCTTEVNVRKDADGMYITPQQARNARDRMHTFTCACLRFPPGQDIKVRHLDTWEAEFEPNGKEYFSTLLPNTAAFFDNEGELLDDDVQT